MSVLRDCLQGITDLAEARLRDDRVTDENVRHDLQEIVRLCGTAIPGLLHWPEPRESGVPAVIPDEPITRPAVPRRMTPSPFAAVKEILDEASKKDGA